LLAYTAVLVGCTDVDRPVAPKRDGPLFSQMAGSAAGRIVFHSNRDGPFQIYSMNPDGSDVVRLTYSGIDEYLPLWSPDGSRITFGRCYSDRCDVVVIDANGGNERTVLSNGFPGAWSPDGNRLAVAGPGGVDILNLQDTGLVNISALPGVRGWSPDGRQILLDGPGDDAIYAYNVDGSGTVQLTHNTATYLSMMFSNDGSRIVFTSDLDGPDNDLFVMNRDGSGVTDITHDDGVNQYDAVFSPNDTQLAFTSDRDGDEDIYVMNADGSGVVNITNNDGIADGGASWVRPRGPANDDFSGAAAIGALPFSDVTNLTSASIESGEPVPSCAIYYGPVSNTTWYAFTLAAVFPV
jgi:Tol biopolymer transport system component